MSASKNVKRVPEAIMLTDKDIREMKKLAKKFKGNQKAFEPINVLNEGLRRTTIEYRQG